MSVVGLLIPVDGPVTDVVLQGGLNELQEHVGGGLIQALDLPSFIPGARRATAYVNEEAKFRPDLKTNMRATDFMVPGIGLQFGDYIAGPMLLVGFSPMSGEHQEALPAGVTQRARLIEAEAA